MWALALALAWGLGLALPALLRGELIGSPHTDLYPSVWGLWWFAEQQPSLPTWTTALGAPEGMPFYYSSPLHGWAAWPLIGLLGVTTTWNVLVVAARVATVLCSYGAGRAWGLNETGALVSAAVFGCAPFFQGYAVEGIVEGLDGWTLALWLWLVALGRWRWASLAFALTVVSSWYLGAVACVLAPFLRRGWASAAAGFVLASPFLGEFLGAFPGVGAMDPDLRPLLGARPSLWTPALMAENPLAITGWVGFTAPVLAVMAARDRPWVAAAVVTCLVLATGVGPWYALPGFEAVRFPYRFIAGALAGIALLAGSRATWAGWAPLIVLEGLLLSPIEPVIPGSPASVHPLYERLEGKVLLDIPGVRAMPPGEVNLTRARARYVLYSQTVHGMGSPWVPDFNSVGVLASDDLNAVHELEKQDGALQLPPDIDWVVVHTSQINQGRAQRALEADGWRLAHEEDDLQAWAR